MIMMWKAIQIIKTTNINNYDIKIIQLDKMISAGEWNNDKRTCIKFFLFFYNNTI